ncbi:MAG: 16S rRNA (cytosine(1402)-N(4))-methyltransferase RsmH [Oscillospiraceae bacterium]|jgi:16S rRNA (cytosine1402-N4)-methyltransferase|nr:16S rRNA (cytosine(1402)-N(4))-methyltransferase RsmH [Oscillospiraceae bacterium]
MDENIHIPHIPVLLAETLELLCVKQGGSYFDGTFGNGGHSRAIAQLGGIVTAADRDPNVSASEGITLIHSSFAEFLANSDTKYDGMLFDLGVSSMQLDNGERGFSFSKDAPLDMRMDTTQSLSAYEIVNTWEAPELARIFYSYGEERYGRQIAQRICERRAYKPIETTIELTELIKGHPKRVFQALRIAVNDELGELERMLSLAPERLKQGGRLVVISFHSLEDRLVKYAFRDDERLNVITKHTVTASEHELANNPRSASAKLRAAGART